MNGCRRSSVSCRHDVAPASAIVPMPSLLHFRPDTLADDALVFSRINLAMMPDPSGIDRVGQEMVKRGPAERGIPGFPAFAGGECFQAPAAALDFREDPDR